MILTDEPSLDDVQFLENQIDEHNMVRTSRRDFRRLALFVRGEQGEILAGLDGYTWAGWLEIKLVWVREDLRGQGHGRNFAEVGRQRADFLNQIVTTLDRQADVAQQHVRSERLQIEQRLVRGIDNMNFGA